MSAKPHEKIETFVHMARMHTKLERVLDAASLGCPFLGRVREHAA
jgi:hypothetical protein